MNHTNSSSPKISAWPALKSIASFSILYSAALFLLALSFHHI